MSSQVNLNNLQVSGISITDSVSLSPAAKASMTSQLSLSSGASMIGGAVNNIRSGNSTFFGLFTTNDAEDIVNFAKVTSIIPLNCIISNFYVSLSEPPLVIPPGVPPPELLVNAYTFTVRKNGVNTGLTVTISNNNTTGSITGVASSISFVEGDSFAIVAEPRMPFNILPTDNLNVRWSAKLTSA